LSSGLGWVWGAGEQAQRLAHATRGVTTREIHFPYPQLEKGIILRIDENRLKQRVYTSGEGLERRSPAGEVANATADAGPEHGVARAHGDVARRLRLGQDDGRVLVLNLGLQNDRDDDAVDGDRLAEDDTAGKARGGRVLRARRMEGGCNQLRAAASARPDPPVRLGARDRLQRQINTIAHRPQTTAHSCAFHGRQKSTSPLGLSAQCISQCDPAEGRT